MIPFMGIGMGIGMGIRRPRAAVTSPRLISGPEEGPPRKKTKSPPVISPTGSSASLYSGSSSLDWSTTKLACSLFQLLFSSHHWNYPGNARHARHSHAIRIPHFARIVCENVPQSYWIPIA
jgi:hypothetical protein